MIAVILQQNPCLHPHAAPRYAGVIAPQGEW
jgi:hypothetical protein